MFRGDDKPSPEFTELVKAAKKYRLSITQLHDGDTAQVWVGPFCMMCSRGSYSVRAGNDVKRFIDADSCGRFLSTHLTMLTNGSTENVFPVPKLELPPKPDPISVQIEALVTDVYFSSNLNDLALEEEVVDLQTFTDLLIATRDENDGPRVEAMREVVKRSGTDSTSVSRIIELIQKRLAANPARILPNDEDLEELVGLLQPLYDSI